MSDLFTFSVLDLVIIAVILFYAYEGYQVGLWQSLLDLGGFLLSFIISLRSYALLAGILTTVFSFPLGLANAGGFFITALILEILFTFLIRRLARFLPPMTFEGKMSRFFHKVNQLLGVLPGMISAGIILAFLLSVLIVLPSSPFLKQAITTSRIGSLLLSNTVGVEKYLHTIFGGALADSLTFFTVEPESTKSVELNFTVTQGIVDKEAEKDMLISLNQEREKAGVAPVKVDPELTELARAYSDRMFKKGYFSHYDDEGKSPFDRMNDAGIVYTYAGENLALAPNVDLAMQGLMNSPGHKENILKPEFKKVGIGVIDGGIYGRMFTQEFTD